MQELTTALQRLAYLFRNGECLVDLSDLLVGQAHGKARRQQQGVRLAAQRL